jgi:hypothetical protein
MNCTICGQESMPGAKLCADCRAARKRAFAATVTQPLLEAAGARRSRSSARLLKPSQSMAAAARRASRKLAAEKGSQLLATPSPRRGLLPVILIAVVLVLVAGAYGAHRMNTVDGAEVKAAADSVPTTTAVPTGRAPPAAPATPTVTTPPGATPTDAVTHASEVTPTLPAAPPKKIPARPRVAPVPAVIALPIPEAPPTIVAAPAPPPPPPKPVVRVDPWQQFNDGISGCAREDFATRPRCEQRIRVRYCEGQWGVAQQCPIGPNTDHGQ